MPLRMPCTAPDCAPPSSTTNCIVHVAVLQLLSKQQLALFCPETLTVAQKLRQDFEKYGIHLHSSQQRSEAARLLALNQHYPARFNMALVSGQLSSTWPACISQLGKVPVIIRKACNLLAPTSRRQCLFITAELTPPAVATRHVHAVDQSSSWTCQHLNNVLVSAGNSAAASLLV